MKARAAGSTCRPQKCCDLFFARNDSASIGATEATRPPQAVWFMDVETSIGSRNPIVVVALTRARCVNGGQSPPSRSRGGNSICAKKDGALRLTLGAALETAFRGAFRVGKTRRERIGCLWLMKAGVARRC